MKLLSLVDESGGETGTVRSDLRGGGRLSAMSPGGRTGGGGAGAGAGELEDGEGCFSESILGRGGVFYRFIIMSEVTDVMCVIMTLQELTPMIDDQSPSKCGVN